MLPLICQDVINLILLFSQQKCIYEFCDVKTLHP